MWYSLKSAMNIRFLLFYPYLEEKKASEMREYEYNVVALWHINFKSYADVENSLHSSSIKCINNTHLYNILFSSYILVRTFYKCSLLLIFKQKRNMLFLRVFFFIYFFPFSWIFLFRVLILWHRQKWSHFNEFQCKFHYTIHLYCIQSQVKHYHLYVV